MKQFMVRWSYKKY